MIQRMRATLRLPRGANRFFDEAWVFFRNPAVKNYIVEALKTWRKQNAAWSF